MKIFCSILLMILVSSFAKNIGDAKPVGVTYYVSTTDGDDSRTPTQAQNSATPWKTLAKVTSFQSSLAAGVTVALKRGDVFDGSITIGKSGTAGNPIKYDAYGSGANPVVNGFYTVTSWTSAGNGLYNATIPAGLSSMGIVTLNGEFQAMGKLPSGPNTYFNVSSTGTNSITSTTPTTNNNNPFTSIPNVVGGEIVWKPNHFVLWRGTINTQTAVTGGGTITYAPFPSVGGGGTENPVVGYGFMIQNHPNLCTSLGQWAYNPASHVFTMYFGSSGPSGYTVKVSSVQTLVSIGGQSYNTFSNISFMGANQYFFNLNGASNITIDHCQMFGSGLYGAFANGTSPNLSITNSYIDRCNSVAVRYSSGSAGGTLTSDTIVNTAAVEGMGGTGEGEYIAIRDIKNSGTVQNCIIRNTGYMPLTFQGSNNVIQNNLIDTFCINKDDGGGIYHGGAPVTGSVVTGNIVLNGFGCKRGTPDNDLRAFGGYIDDHGSGSIWTANTFANNADAGLYIHSGHDVVLSGNTSFNNANSQLRIYDDEDSSRNITLSANIFFAELSSQYCFKSSGGRHEASTFFSSADNNAYTRPIAETQTFQKSVPSTANYTLAGWKSYTGKEASSRTAGVTVTTTNDLRFDYNATGSSTGVSLGGNSYQDAFGNSYSGTLSLAAWSSKVLIKVAGGGNTAPTANAGSSTTITLPTNSVTLSASGSSDPDGTIASYAWTKVSGPASYAIVSPTNVSTVVNSLTQGVYVFEVQVTDNGGASATAQVTITVSGGNAAPNASAGPNQTIYLPASSVALNAGASVDPDGSIASYQWTIQSKPTGAPDPTLTTPTLATTSATGLVNGQYKFRVTVTDNHSPAATDYADVTVNVQPQLPGVQLEFKYIRYSMIPTGDSLVWAADNTQDLKSYTLQQSVDGVSWTDNASLPIGTNAVFVPFKTQSICMRKMWTICIQKKNLIVVTHYYFRVKATDKNNVITYSAVIKT
jgi:hypothetical protein